MSQARDPKNLSLIRTLLVTAGVIYLAWWGAVELFLPSSYNPLGSRLAVVAAFLGLWLTSFKNDFVRRNIGAFYATALWLLTAHFFYLFRANGGDNNWVIGAFITVLAVTYGLFTQASLAAYSVFVAIVAAVIFFTLPSVRASLFLPGVYTILLQTNLGFATRQRLGRRLQESDERTRQLSHTAEVQRMLAEAMQENVRARDEFISLASHELKTPITSLKLWTQMLEQSVLGNERPSEEYLQRTSALMDKQITRISKLVETMLDASQVASGNLRIARERVDLAALARDVVTMLGLQSLQAGTPLSLDAPESLFVMGDPSRLAQLIENFLSNAMKYGNRRPVRVTLESVEGRVLLRVTDQGLGIEERDLDRIFERFERVKGAANVEGLGLGLYLSRQIAAAHGGSIAVSSAPGAGSTFTAILPSCD